MVVEKPLNFKNLLKNNRKLLLSKGLCIYINDIRGLHQNIWLFSISLTFLLSAIFGYYISPQEIGHLLGTE